MCDSLQNDLKELKPSNALILRKHYINMLTIRSGNTLINLYGK